MIYLCYEFFSIVSTFQKIAEKKERKKNGGKKNDESVAMSSMNVGGDESQKALTGDTF